MFNHVDTHDFRSIFSCFQPKCDRYWPEKKGEEAEYGPFKVRLVDEQRLEQLEEKTFKRELQVIFSPVLPLSPSSPIADDEQWKVPYRSSTTLQ